MRCRPSHSSHEPAERRPRGVVDLRSSYVEGLALPEIAREWAPLLEDALPRLAGRPVLYCAAERDGMVARSSVEELFERAPEPKTFAMVESDHTTAAEHARGTVLAWLNARHPRVDPHTALDVAESAAPL